MHPDEVRIDEGLVRWLVDRQFPHWAELPLVAAGHGTDNRMMRLGDRLVVRLPRTPDTAAALAKEQTWLPRLGPQLPLAVPEPVAVGRPDESYPFPWSVYRWIEGHPLDPDTVEDPARLGRDLAGFVRALHGVELMGARRAGALASYRGGSLRDISRSTWDNIEACLDLPDLTIDLNRLKSIWTTATEWEESPTPHTWMHADLKPSNLLVRDGRLVGVIDFGVLSVGDPTCEHAATWDLPAEARDAYADELGLDRGTRLRAKAWALAIAVAGVPYYWSSWPDFAQECLRRLRLILRDTTVG